MGNGELKSQYSPIFPRVGIPRGQPLDRIKNKQIEKRNPLFETAQDTNRFNLTLKTLTFWCLSQNPRQFIFLSNFGLIGFFFKPLDFYFGLKQRLLLFWEAVIFSPRPSIWPVILKKRPLFKLGILASRFVFIGSWLTGQPQINQDFFFFFQNWNM